MTADACDKGPILNQLLESVQEFRYDQKRMVGALIDIAKQQERLVALADRTADNQRDIDTLYKIQREEAAHLENVMRELDQKVQTHLVGHPSPESCKLRKSLSPNVDGKFDKVQVAVILAMVYFLANQVWSILHGLVKLVQSIPSGTPL